MKLIKLLGVLCLGTIIVIGCGGDDGNGADDYNTKTVNNITLQWKTDTLGNLLVKVSATTVGWIAVGFDPTAGMQDANIIIGYVLNDTAHIRDDFGTGLHAHVADTTIGGTDDVSDKAGSEIGGVTEISFTIPLDSGDPRDRVLEIGQSYQVILALGADDAFDLPHTVRVTTEIDI
jgi:hypothetical protein